MGSARRRLVTCQGTANLVTALAVMELHERSAPAALGAPPPEDHLLIYGLAVPAEQVKPFAAVIERFALALHPFRSVSLLEDQQVEALWAEMQAQRNMQMLVPALHRLTGLDVPDEVFVVRDWQMPNTLVLNAFPGAKHICYGDAIGVYLPPNYLAPRPALRERLSAALRRLGGAASKEPWPDARLDVSYLALPGAFGTPRSGAVMQADMSILQSVFARLRPFLDRSWMNDLRTQAAGRALWVLMGSNFSEQGAMTMRNEVLAYRHWIESQSPQKDAILIVKPHPRDSTMKLRALQDELNGSFSQVLTASGSENAYLPFEAVLLDLLTGEAGEAPRTIDVMTFSSACLTVRHVLRLKPRIGFGKDLVGKYFAPAHRAARNQHESDLRRLCSTLPGS
jgi:hypothetical protein